MLDDCRSGQRRGAVWLQLLTYIQSEGSNAYYVNSSAIFSGKLCQLFRLGGLCCWTNPCPIYPHLSLSPSPPSYHSNGDSHRTCQIAIKRLTNVLCQPDVELCRHTSLKRVICFYKKESKAMFTETQHILQRFRCIYSTERVRLYYTAPMGIYLSLKWKKFVVFFF